MYCTRASLEKRILELVSIAVETGDETSPWSAIRKEYITKLVSDGYILSEESLGFVCVLCKKMPCMWRSVGLQILPTIFCCWMRKAKVQLKGVMQNFVTCIIVR